MNVKPLYQSIDHEVEMSADVWNLLPDIFVLSLVRTHLDALFFPRAVRMELRTYSHCHR